MRSSDEEFFAQPSAAEIGDPVAANDAGDEGARQMPPHDMHAEGAVLSAVMLDPSALGKVNGTLRPEHFYSEAHRRIHEACVELGAEGQPVDVVQVATRLRERDRLAQAGGWTYLTQILNAAPAVANVGAYAETVCRAWRKRQTVAIGQRLEALARTGGDVGPLLQELQALETIQQSPSGPALVSLIVRARSLRARCPVVRLSTGLPTLDKNCHGGLRLGTVAIIGGAPGVGKTALVVDQAHRWARAGVPVAFLAADEGPDDILMRLALHEGVAAALLEQGDPEAWAYLEERLADLPLQLFDGDDGHTLESVAERLAAVAGGAPSILVGDSVQTITPAGALLDADGSPRSRVDLVVRNAKRVARGGPLVLLTSELGRGAYRNRVNADNVTPLAAFKESSGIEYGAQTALVLRSVAGGEGRVEVDVPKNRGGFRDGFFLEVDAMTRVREVNAPVEEQGEEGERTRTVGKIERSALQVLQIIANNPGIGERDLRAKVAAAGLKIGVGTLDAIKEHLLTTGRLENRGTTQGKRTDAHWHAVGAPGEVGGA